MPADPNSRSRLLQRLYIAELFAMLRIEKFRVWDLKRHLRTSTAFLHVCNGLCVAASAWRRTTTSLHPASCSWYSLAPAYPALRDTMLEKSLYVSLPIEAMLRRRDICSKQVSTRITTVTTVEQSVTKVAGQHSLGQPLVAALSWFAC